MDSPLSKGDSGPAVTSSSSSDNLTAADEVPDWLTQYTAEMEIVAKRFPVSEEELAAVHTKYYDAAYEKMMLGSPTAGGGESGGKRPVEDRIRSKKERAALAAAKAKFVELNDSASVASFLSLLGDHDKNPLSEEGAAKFIGRVLSANNGESDSSRQMKMAAVALSRRINSLSVSGDGADSARLSAAKVEADAALEAQIGANRLLGSRVEELERENSELHRILDDNTNKALDSWSSGQLKIAKLEEELKNAREEKKAAEKAAEDARAETKLAETKLERLKSKMEAFVDEENEPKGEMGFMESAFACIPGIPGFNVKE